MKLIHKCIFFLVLVALLQIAVFGVFSFLLAESEAKLEQARYSVLTANRATALNRGVQEWASMMLLASMSKRPEFKLRYKHLCAEIPIEFDNVQKEVSGNKEDSADISKAKEKILYLMAGIEEMRSRLLTSPDVANIMRIKQYIELAGHGHLSDAGEALVRVLQRHKMTASSLGKLQRDRQEKFRLVLASGIIVSLFSMSCLVVGFSRGVNERLGLINENFLLFRRRAPLKPAMGKGDEICTLDSSFRELARELEDASEKDKAVFTHLPAGLITCRADGTIQSLNPAAETLLGLLSTEAEGRPVTTLLADEPSLINADTHLSSGKHYFATPKDPRAPVEVTVSSFRLKESPMLLFALVDVSAKEEVEQMKQEFLSIVSHDLQTPLTSIKLSLTMLKEGEICPLNEASKKILDVAAREADRLVRLTRDLLDLARAESGNVILRRQVVSTAAVVEQAIGAVLAAAAQKQIELIDRSADIEVNVDPDRICQILVNFLSNAVKYSPAATTVTIEVARKDEWVVFSVIDQGRGIPQDQVGLVFERFRQVYSDDAAKGSGLGLAICKLFADSHGGTVSVESEEGKGSRFMLSVPVA